VTLRFDGDRVLHRLLMGVHPPTLTTLGRPTGGVGDATSTRLHLAADGDRLPARVRRGEPRRPSSSTARRHRQARPNARTEIRIRSGLAPDGLDQSCGSGPPLNRLARATRRGAASQPSMPAKPAASAGPRSARRMARRPPLRARARTQSTRSGRRQDVCRPACPLRFVQTRSRAASASQQHLTRRSQP
jgi:hypothetical protein